MLLALTEINAQTIGEQSMDNVHFQKKEQFLYFHILLVETRHKNKTYTEPTYCQMNYVASIHISQLVGLIFSEESDMVIWQANQSGVASTIAINGRVSGNKRHRYSVMKDRNKQKHHLVIEEAGLDDEGTFMCEVFGSNPVSQQHSLIVNGK